MNRPVYITTSVSSVHLVESLTLEASYRIWLVLFGASQLPLEGERYWACLASLASSKKDKSTTLSVRCGVRTNMPTSSDLAQQPIRRDDIDVIYPKIALFNPCFCPSINYSKRENANLKNNS